MKKQYTLIYTQVVQEIYKITVEANTLEESKEIAFNRIVEEREKYLVDQECDGIYYKSHKKNQYKLNI